MQLGRNRVEALTDGIFAVAMTLLSEYSSTRLAIGIYGGNLIAIGLTLALHWWYATAESRHVDPTIDRALVRGAMYRTLMGPFVYLLAIVLSFIKVELSLILYALVPILYILPGRIDVHWIERHQGKSKTDQGSIK